MEILAGMNIKIFCKNGLFEAGTVVERTDQQLVLELIDKSKMIILNPYENIVAIKISGAQKKSSPISNVLVEETLEPTTYERREDLRALELAELHKLKAAEERKRAKELLQTHKPSSPEVSFGTPNFTQSLYQHPKAKTRRRH